MSVPGRFRDFGKAHPLVRKFEQLIRDQGLTLTEVQTKAGYNPATMHHWRDGKHTPNIDTFNDLLSITGHRLAIVKIAPDRRVQLQATTFHLIERLVAEVFFVAKEALRNNSRRREVALPRMALMLVATEQNWSSTAIGQKLGRDHTTILHGIERAQELIRRDKFYAEKVDEVRHRLEEKLNVA